MVSTIDADPGDAAPRRANRDRWLRRVLVALVLAALLGLAWFSFTDTASGGADALSASTTGNDVYQLEMDFGLARGPLKRTIRLDLCDRPTSATRAECDDEDAQPVGEDGQERPAVLATNVESDLASKVSQFPADQLTLAASNVGRNALLVEVSADPEAPTSVLAGTYRGRVVVDRDGDVTPVKIDLIVRLERREGAVSRHVLAVLLLGALLGAGVRWLDKELAPLALVRRRYTRLRRWVGRRADAMPAGATEHLDDVRAAIRQLDTDGVDDTLTGLTGARADLTEFAYAWRAIRTEISEQSRLGVDEAVRAVTEAAVKTEQAYLTDLLQRPWPWEGAEGVRTGYQRALVHVRALTALLREHVTTGDADTAARVAAKARQIIAAGTVGLEAEALPGSDDPQKAPLLQAQRVVDVAPPEPQSQTPASEAQPDTRRNLVEWGLDNIWWITAVVGSLLVMLAGYQTQFLNNAGYTDSAKDRVTLFLWALAIQIAGATVVEVAGRLGASSSSGTTTGP